jgi:hypothetical protein
VQSSGAECQKEDSSLEGMHSTRQEEHCCSLILLPGRVSSQYNESLPSVHFCFLRRTNQASYATLTAAGLLPDIPRTDSLGSETRDLSSIELRHTHTRAHTQQEGEGAREREGEQVLTDTQTT